MSDIRFQHSWVCCRFSSWGIASWHNIKHRMETINFVTERHKSHHWDIWYDLIILISQWCYFLMLLCWWSFESDQFKDFSEIMVKGQKELNSVSLPRDKLGKAQSGSEVRFSFLRTLLVLLKTLDLSVQQPPCDQSAMGYLVFSLCNVATLLLTSSKCMIAFYWLCPIFSCKQ